MALSAKLCLVACLFFTGGTCWLVTQVAKPIVNIPSTVAEPAALAKSSPRVPEASPLKRAEKLERATPTLETAGEKRDAHLDVVAVRDEPVAHTPVNRVQLPPLVAPPVEAMTVAHAEPVTRENAEPVRTISNSALLIAQPNLTSPVGATDEVLKPDARNTKPDLRTAKITEVTVSTQAPVENAATYTVKRGDSLAKIARATLGSSSPEAIRKLMDANPALKRKPDLVFAGQVLTIPGDAPSNDSATAVADAHVEKPKMPIAKPKPADEKPVVASASRKTTGTAKKEPAAKNDAVAIVAKPAPSGKAAATRTAAASGTKPATASKGGTKPDAKPVAKADAKKPVGKTDTKASAKGSDAKSASSGAAKKGDNKAVSAAEKKDKDAKRG